MAVNPNLDFFDKDGNMVEIADDVTGYYLIGPHLVPIYHLPSHFNLYGRRG
jgi:hypothetical protein